MVKRRGVLSVIDAELIFLTTIVAKPAPAIPSQIQEQAFVVLLCCIKIKSPAVIKEFVNVNVEEEAAIIADENIVIFPQSLFNVTPVVLDVNCVIVPPAPVV